MVKAIFDDPLKRKQCFEEFLCNKFSKDFSLVTKEEFLSLTQKDFKDKSINKISVGSAGTLLNIISKQNPGQNAIFSILQDTGYTEKFNITEKEFIDGARQKRAMGSDIFSTPTNRLLCFNEFLQNKFNKEASEVTKEEFLSLTQKDFRDKSIIKTSVGSAGSLLIIISKQNPGQNAIFSIFQDTGYAQKLNISHKELIDGARQKAQLGHDIFSTLTNRLLCFNEFLKNKFSKNASLVTKEELLSLGTKDFYDKSINKTSVGSAGSLHRFISNQNPGKNAIFSLLQDTGYTEKFNISEQDVRSASASNRLASSANNKSVVIYDPRFTAVKQPKNLVLPERELITFQRHDTSEIQIVMSTEWKAPTSPNAPNAKTRQKPLIDQAIERYFGPEPAIISDGNIQTGLRRCEAGSSVVIKSGYPLDDIFQQGLELAGFQLVEANVKFKVGIKDYDKLLHSHYASKVEKVQEPTWQVDALYFENHLYPARLLFNTAGLFSRVLRAAEFDGQLMYVFKQSTKWFYRIEMEGILPAGELEQLKGEYYDKLTEAYSARRQKLSGPALPDLVAKHGEFVKKLNIRQQRVEQTLQKAKQRELLRR